MARKTLAALGALALALLMVSALSLPVEARHGGGGGNGGRGGHGGWSGHHGSHGGHHRGFSSGHRFSGTPHAHRHFHHRRFHGRAFIDGPYYNGYGAYDNSCYWLRRRAQYTGSGYWWNRYYACLSAYDY